MEQRTLISQSEAARIKKVSRQRINELIGQKRLCLATNDKGKRGLWLDEVEALELKPVGRPRLTEEALEARAGKFRTGDLVRWRFDHKIGLSIVAEVVKVTSKRLRVTFTNADGKQEAWANQTDCQLEVSEPASDNGNGKIPGIREMQTGT